MRLRPLVTHLVPYTRGPEMYQMIRQKTEPFLGITLDWEANNRRVARISADSSRVSAWVIPTNEELMIARHTNDVLGLVEARA